MTTHDDALREAEARLGSAVAYVEYRATADVEGLDEIIDAAIEVGRLRALAEVNEHRQCQVCGAIDGEQHGWEHDEIRTALREAGQS